MEIITLNEARAKNLTHYFTGKPCKNGHISPRFVSARKCVDCQKEQSRESLSSRRDHWNAVKRQRRKERPEPLEVRQRNVARMRRWVKNNKERHQKWYRDYQKNRIKNDKLYAVTRNLRGRINSVVRKGYKSATTLRLLGCSPQALMAHLEAQFQDGMSWDNYGDWHIDHIRPCASFDLLDPEQQAQCFHFTNLQPLWAEDNIRKGDSYQ